MFVASGFQSLDENLEPVVKDTVARVAAGQRFLLTGIPLFGVNGLVAVDPDSAARKVQKRE